MVPRDAHAETHPARAPRVSLGRRVRLGRRGSRRPGGEAPQGRASETRGLMARWTRFVLRHRFVVLALWIVIFLVAGAAASRLSDLLTNRFTLPGTDSQRAEKILQ